MGQSSIHSMKFLILFLSCVSAASNTCCKKKKLEDIEYTLSESDKDAETSTFGCKDGCIYYKTGEDPSVERFCFKDGGSIVTCLPEFWGDEFPECNGKSQSPIDIVTGPTPVAEPSPLTFGNYDKIRIDMLSNSEEHYHYPGAPEEEETIRLENGTIKNNGHTAQLDVIATIPGDVGILSGGNLTGEYQILQLHFHWGADDTKGSEHTLDGKMFPLELHIVHRKVGEPDFLAVSGGLAVTGF